MKIYVRFLATMLLLGLTISCANQKIANANSDLKYKIERIEYSTSPCFGTCPQFKFEIEKDRKAIYTAVRFNLSKDYSQESPEAIFEGKIDENTYNSLVKKLNDMDFPTLQNRYKVQWTDAQTGTLKITYDNGKVKEISDYGKRGTPELIEIHQLFLDLRESQNWVKR